MRHVDKQAKNAEKTPYETFVCMKQEGLGRLYLVIVAFLNIFIYIFFLLYYLTTKLSNRRVTNTYL